MTSLLEGQREANCRERTDKAVMLAVAFTPRLTMCSKCGKRRTTVTGQFSSGGLFKCHQCAGKVKSNG